MAAPIEFEGYTIQPPKEFTITPAPSDTPPVMKLLGLQGPRRDDGSAGMITITVLRPPMNERRSLDEFHGKMLAGIQRRRTDWKASNPEKVEIHGVASLRTLWVGKNSANGSPMSGAIYSMLQGADYISISTQDVDPHSDATLKITEPSVRTFKKK